MQDVELLFAHKKANPSKMTDFGFRCKNGKFLYRVLLPSTRLEMTVIINGQGSIKTEVTDPKTKSPYVLHITGGQGKFVGAVRAEYECLLQEIAAKCFDRAIFKTPQAQHVLAYALEKYGNEPEYLWKQFPTNAVLRRTDNAKWYAAILQISPVKLGLPPGLQLEILDLRTTPENLEHLVDHNTYFPGYHMNKKHWVTLCLNNSIPTQEILQRIDESWQLAYK